MSLKMEALPEAATKDENEKGGTILTTSAWAHRSLPEVHSTTHTAHHTCGGGHPIIVTRGKGGAQR